MKGHVHASSIITAIRKDVDERVGLVKRSPACSEEEGTDAKSTRTSVCRKGRLPPPHGQIEDRHEQPWTTKDWHGQGNLKIALRGGGGGVTWTPAEGGGGVGEMGFRVGPFVLCKNGCWRQRHRNTKFGLKKFFPPIISPPNI